MLDPENLTPSKENYPAVKVHSKRAHWYSPCKSSPKIPLSPESDVPTLKLTHFTKVPKISFGTVAVGSSKTEPFIVFNPHPLSQTLEVVRCPTDKGFTLELNGSESNEDFDERVMEISPKEEKFLSITWEPKEGGTCREIIRFRWDGSPQLQVIVFGTAVEPTLPKSKVKRCLKPQISMKMSKPVLQPSQVPNTCGTVTGTVTGFGNDVANKHASENYLVENEFEENLRRDTFVVIRAKPQKCKTKPNPSPQESFKTKLKSSPPASCKMRLETPNTKLVKPTIKGNSSVKRSKVIVSKKKLSPSPGILKKKPKPRVKLKVAAKGVAQRKLQLVKTPKNSLPRHPMPFAARNMYYDERWIEKQEEGFTKWLNFVLTPPDVCDSVAQADIHKGNVVLGGSKSQPLAPTKEVLSFRAYTARRKMARLRRTACLLYQSEPLGHIIRKIEAEVENGRLAIRTDKKLHADLGIKRQVVDMLLSYNPLWLRIGLETIYGEILPIQSNHDVAGLTRFLTDRLLGNPDIAKAFAHPQVPGLFREGYVEQLGKFTLKKFLLLVLFLDRAKLTRLIDHDPCLFNKEASFKSNRSLLLTFSREYLKGEGDLTKHLNFLGYSVTHSQRAIDEVDYAVKNIAIDLRDGLRLTRVTELLTQEWQLSASLRAPAISRLQKIHNVDVFMTALKTRGVLLGGCGIDARHLVDGHREKTLALLWQIIFHFQVKVLLSEKLLKEEIAHLESTRLLHNQLTAAENWTDDGDPNFAGKRRDSSNLYFKSERLRLLFQWCKMVCRLYDLKIENFTVSFSDGRALCYLVHHYHPSLLPLSMIKEQTSLTINPGVHDTSDSEEEEEMEINSWTTKFSPGSDKNTLLEELKNNERENFRTVAEKVKELGGVPLMTKASDMSYTIPDEKVVITYVAYLCARLLDLREETKAARCIQMAWRRYRLKAQLERKQAVARIIVSIQARARAAILHRRFRAMKESAVRIQSVYRGHLARQRLRARHQAAQCIQTRYLAFKKGREVQEWYSSLRQTVVRLQAIVLAKQRGRLAKRNWAASLVQTAWKGYSERKRFIQQRTACIKIQALVRGFLQRKSYLRLYWAAVVIQETYRGLMLGREKRRRYLHFRKSIVSLQSCYRGKRDRQRVKQIRAAIKIQSHVRARQTRARFQVRKRATVKIQAYTRGYQTQRKFASLKSATRVLQGYFRAFLLGRLQRVEYETQRAACIKIQSLIRCRFQRKAFLQQRDATIRLQSLVRKFLTRKRYQKLLASAVFIQRRFRDLLCVKKAKQNFQDMKLSALKVQSCYRGYRCRKQFTRVRQATILLQSHARCMINRKKLMALKCAASVIQIRYRAMLQGRDQRLEYQWARRVLIRLQAIVRGTILRRRLLAQHRSAIRIQAFFRQYFTSKRYHELKRSAIVIQRRYRSILLMREHVLRYQRVRSAVQCIQAHFRGYRARQFYKVSKATVVLQSAVRGWQVRKDLQHQHLAAIVIQAFYRSYVHRDRYLSLRWAAMVLQRRYRSVILARETRSSYQHMRRAAVKIQSIFRGCQARKQARRLRSARKIQAVYRGFVARKSYNITRDSVILAQSTARGYLARKYYTGLKKATLMLQRRYRARLIGICQYVHYHVQRGACILLQAAWRGYLCRKRYQETKNAVIVFQRRYKGMIAGRNQRRRFLAMKTAAIRLQACTRGWFDRKLATRQRAARTIQATYRMHKARREFLAVGRAVVKMQAQTRMVQQRRRFNILRNSAVVIQRRFRATILCKRDQFVYHFIRGAVVTIQMVARGYLVRVKLRRMRNAAIKIQACVRGFLARRKYEATKRAALVLQLRWRALLLGRAVAQNYNALRSSALVIQSSYRQYRARQEFKRHRAATKIQSSFRRYTCRSKFVAQRSSVVIIQAAVRCYFQQRLYLKLRSAAMIIQHQFRAQEKMQKAKQRYATQRNACIALQSEVRGWLCRRRYNKIRSAAITIQQRRRAALRTQKLRKDFLQLKNATVIVQSYWRMLSVRRRYEITRNAVLRIQAIVRKRRAMLSYENLKKVTILLQRRRRANQLCKEQRRLYQAMRKGAIVIQSHIRGLQARHRVAKMVEERLRRETAALTIQRYYRGYRLVKKTVLAYHITRGAIITLQAACRMYTARKFVRKLRAIIKVQAIYRGKIQRRKFMKVRETVCRLQAIVRRHQAREQYEKSRKAIVVIQQWYRAQKAMKKIYREYHCIRDATVLIQSHFRRHHQRQVYLLERRKVVLIQSVVRMRLERRRFLQKRSAATAIQRRYRSYILVKAAHRRYQLMRSAATSIQSYYRGWQARRQVKKLKAAILIQSQVRGVVERRRYFRTRMLVIRIQAMLRSRCCQQNYCQLKNAVIVLQRRVRANIAAKNERKTFLETKRVTVKLQSSYRGRKVRCLVRKLKAVILIQRWFRAISAGMKVRAGYYRIREAALVIQAAFRGYHGRVIARKMRAARMIQSAIRGFLTRKMIEHQKTERLVQLKHFTSTVYHHLSAITIQRYYRRARATALAKAHMDAVLLIQHWWRGVMERQRFTRLRSTAVVVQRIFQRKLEVKNRRAAKIQALVRGFLTRKQLKKTRESALRIQAFWRGYRVRREVSSVKVKIARKRIEFANAAATESMKLCNRTRSALDFLLQCKNISRIVGALVNLEVVTRLSEVCCQQVVKDGALPVIFKVIKKCNRSLPHLEVIKNSLSILYNVAKFSSVYRAVYEEPDSINTLVELLVNFRDKSFVFSKTCCLLVVLCRDSSITHDILNMTKIVEDIKSVHKIAERNHKLEAKRNKIRSKVEKPTCLLAPSTPCKHTPYKGKKPNTFKWQRQVDVVQDPLEAVRLLVRRLCLVSVVD